MKRGLKWFLACLFLTALPVTGAVRVHALPVSDTVTLDIFGAQVPNGIVHIPLGSLTEAQEAAGTVLNITVPVPIVIQFTDPGNPPPVSDFLVIAPFQMRLTSDTNPNGLPPRPNAVQIGLEQNNQPFAPITFTMVSDSNDTDNSDSDRLTIVVPVPGGTVNFPLTEFTEDQPVQGVVPPLSFDISEAPNVISDQIDLSRIPFAFASDLNPSGLPQGAFFISIPEKTGFNDLTEVMIQLVVVSDVPEPSSLALLGLSVAGAAGLTRLRRGRAAPHERETKR